MKKSNYIAELSFLGVLLIIDIAFITQLLETQQDALQVVDAVEYARVIIALFTVALLAVIVQSLMRFSKYIKEHPGPDRTAEEKESALLSWKLVGATGVIFLFYCYFIDKLGYYTTGLIVLAVYQLVLYRAQELSLIHILPFEAGEDGVPFFAERGTAYRYHMCSNVHTEKGFPADTNNEAAAKLIARLHKKLENYADEILTYKTFGAEEYDTLIVTYGCVTRAARDAAEALNRDGARVGVLQLQSLWPFPKKLVAEYAAKAKKVLMPEINMGQLIDQVRLATDRPVEGLNRFDGAEITPQQIIEKVRAM